MLAIIFESVGVGEWFVLLAVLLIVVGPKNLPSTARKFGQYYAKFRRAADGFRRQLLEMDTEIERTMNAAEREASESFGIAGDEASAVPEDENFGEPMDRPEEEFDGEPVDEPTQASAEPPFEKPTEKPTRDLSAVKISVSPAPEGKTAHGD